MGENKVDFYKILVVWLLMFIAFYVFYSFSLVKATNEVEAEKLIEEQKQTEILIEIRDILKGAEIEYID